MEAMLDRRNLLIAAGATTMAMSFGCAMRRPVSGGSAKAGAAYRSAGELVAALATRQVSAIELVDQSIARIEALDPRINAVVVRDFDRARTTAREADAALARGDRRPLLGLPMTVKESFNVAGLPTTWGNPGAKGWQPTEDAVAVARLKEAGAVILGKTNVPTGIVAFSDSRNAAYGATNNPWDPARTPGGSSGGSAAALAAGLVPLELGSDLGGSIRIPAHFCGVYGHKPSSLLVPLRGHVPPRAPVLEVTLSAGLAAAGPMARSAADLALALDVLAGPDESEAGAYRVALPPPRHADLESYRVLVLDTHPLLPVQGPVRVALERLADRLAVAGVKVARSSPLVPDLAEVARLRERMVGSFGTAGRPADYFQRVRESVAALPATDNSLMAARLRGALMSHTEWMAAEVQRARVRQQCRALFQQFDVMLCPPYWDAAPAHGALDWDNWEERRVQIDGRAYAYNELNVWSTFASVIGLPATVAPIGRTASGLPVGVQIVGPFLEDRSTISFAAMLEREFGGFVSPSGFA